MRSEHNRGASLAAFLLAVSTMTLLFVSPVEGQLTPCTTNADCEAEAPFCIVPDGETEGICGECVISAFPGETGSCDAGELCARNIEDARLNLCAACSALNFIDTDTPAACQILATDFSQEADVVANCQRECFGFFACTSDAINANGDVPIFACPTNETSLAFCDVPVGETEGACGECVVGAFPGESGSCAVIPAGQVNAGRQICGRNPEEFLEGQAFVARAGCVPCVAADQEFQFEFGTDATAADCQLLASDFNQTEDVVANCERECFAVYSCDSDADCTDTLPICNAGQCAVSAPTPTPTFSPTDGMGGGSSA